MIDFVFKQTITSQRFREDCELLDPFANSKSLLIILSGWDAISILIRSYTNGYHLDSKYFSAYMNRQTQS